MTKPLLVGKILSRELLLIVGFALIVGGGITFWHWNERDRLERQFIAQELSVVVDHKRAEVEGALSTVYQNIRTISLLPSVKAIRGGNRHGEDEDVVKSGRFTPEGWSTVQQIYNNMASKINVSEIYAVIEGLDSKTGQIPFFMFDTVVFNGHKSEADNPSPSPDRPEESEEEEYQYFPLQMGSAKAAHPRFDFKTMDDIPVYASPMMRTCDNAQYLSKAQGNVRDAYGMLYSVPFYDNEGGFRGVISAIVRANVLEAILMGAPFVPITDSDKALQKHANWSLPEPSRFILRNDRYDIAVFDRRHQSLPDMMQHGREGRNVFHLTLSVPGDSPWRLSYYLPEQLIGNATAAHDRTFMTLLTAVLVLSLLAAIASVNKRAAETEMASLVKGAIRGDFSGRFRTQGKMGSIKILGAGLNSLLESSKAALDEAGRVLNALANGDLTQRMDGQYHGTLGNLQRSCNATVTQLARMIHEIRESASAVEVAAGEITAGNSDLARRTEAQATSLERTASNMSALAQQVSHNAARADDVRKLAATASGVAEQGAQTVSQVVTSIQGMAESARKISEIIGVIDGISLQTSILALNAEIEAARAGESGRGFAVVAGEVRTLAERSGIATQRIKKLIGESVASVEVGTEHAARAGRSMDEIVTSGQHVVQFMADIAKASAEQRDEIQEVNHAVTDMDDTTQQNAALVEQATAAAESLEEQARRLVQAVSVFRLKNHENSP